jgi:hypothetical protein
MMKLLCLGLGVSALFLSSLLAADEVYACQHDGIERTVRVVYESADSQIPCRVVYEKAAGNQTLWSSLNEVGYCEGKAESFVEKQRGWGWDCTKLESTAAAE